MKQRVVLIAGPTASGKSQAAIGIAEQLGGVVINADAMQVYRDLKIVTARPCPEDEARVPHHLFGHVDADQRYSVGQWLSDIQPVLKAAARRGQAAVVVGGTGLYFKALCEGLSEVPEVPASVSGRWQRMLKEEGPWALHAVLMARDAQGADALDPNDGHRIVRALCVHEVTGKSIRQLNENQSQPLISKSDVLFKAILMPEREELYQRIEQRFDDMIGTGALEEVKALVARQLEPGLPVMKAIGVPELSAHLAGGITLEDAAEKAKTHSRRYAKRQMTWARGQMADWTVYKTTPQQGQLS